MAKRKTIPKYGTVILNGTEYFRTRIEDADGKRVALYGKTREELYDKVEEARREVEDCTFRRSTPTVKEYCEKWLLMQSAHVRNTTMLDYTSKVKNYIIKPLGHMYMADVTTDDVKLAIVLASKKSESVYRSVNMLMKCIFESAEDSHVIDENPTKKLSNKGGIPPKDKEALTDGQVEQLLDAIRDLPPYLFVMIGLYAGLRREEILGLKWDCVFLDGDTPYIAVRRAWHVEHNRPIILTELKTKAAKRDVPMPMCLTECLREAKAKSKSEFVIANSEGGPLSYTQFKRVWQYIVTRSTKERTYVRYLRDGRRIRRTIKPVLGEVAPHNGRVVYSLDFQVTPHQLRHTYITNLIYAHVDPKTVQYLAGHENSKITMDIYAKVKYNKPTELAAVVNGAFNQGSG
ncbi:MAG: site-specific integrase [Lachnospiraceae bacterium]|nr:site-specific integrase [Lachnospiraceae bacterium]